MSQHIDAMPSRSEVSALNGNIAMKDKLISKQTTSAGINLTVENSSVNFIIGEGNGGSRSFIFLVQKYGSAAINPVEIYKAPNVSYSVSGNTLTIDTNDSSGNMINIRSINVRGSQIS